MKLKIFRIISLLFLLSIMLLIYNLSAETAAESSKTSGGFSKLILSLFYPDFKTFSSEHQNEIISSFSFLIRKMAHFTLYGLLGFWVQMSIITYRNIPFITRNLMACAVCLVYSVFDELHQTFVSGRSGELRDVLIDLSGAVICVVLSAFVIRYNKRLFNLVKDKR